MAAGEADKEVTMARRAVLIGINKYKVPGADLRGCVNDVRNLQGVLTTYYGFAAKDIVLLTDFDATKTAMEKAIGKPIKIEKKESTPATRIALLSSNAVDLIAGTMTDTPQRRESVDFSLTFFYTGAQFLVKKGSPIKSVNDIAGKRIAVPVQNIDLVPTILDLVRAPIPNDLKGRSLKPLLTDEDGRIVAQSIYAESLAAYLRFGGHPTFALTVNDSRYIRGVSEEIVQIEPAPPARTCRPSPAKTGRASSCGSRPAPSAAGSSMARSRSSSTTAPCR